MAQTHRMLFMRFTRCRGGLLSRVPHQSALAPLPCALQVVSGSRDTAPQLAQKKAVVSFGRPTRACRFECLFNAALSIPRLFAEIARMPGIVVGALRRVKETVESIVDATIAEFSDATVTLFNSMTCAVRSGGADRHERDTLLSGV